MSLFQCNLPGIPVYHRGKVREVYDFGERLLIVATDRISAFDWVLPSTIPGKGKILTSMSAFWFDFTKNLVKNHFVSCQFADFPPSLEPFREQLQGRAMLVKKARRIDFECVARGYLAGSLFKEYCDQPAKGGVVHLYGNSLPAGLRLADRLPEPIFTPATKSETGHDVNVDAGYMAQAIGWELTSQLRRLTLEIYTVAAEYASARGIIIADTKLEFGFADGDLMVIDELLSPDSSRFWPVAFYKPGSSPPSFDKQYVRDWLEQSGWDKNSPPPALPLSVIERTAQLYKEAHRLLVGREIDD